jgi:hypothetical protein
MKNIFLFIPFLLLSFSASAQEQDPCYSINDFISQLDIKPPISYQLSVGWNMVGYGCPTPTDLVVAMYALEDFILIMKDNNGQVYMPEFGFNGVGDLTPGYGYQLKVNDYILDFNICE